MPTVFKKYGIRFHFYGSDMNEPIHIHASGLGGKAKVWLNPIRIEDHQGFKDNDLKRILVAVEEHRTEILEVWDEFFKSVS